MNDKLENTANNMNNQNIDGTKIDTDEESSGHSDLFQVDAKGRTLFCKAIEEHNYTKLIELIGLLKRIKSPNTEIRDNVICRTFVLNKVILLKSWNKAACMLVVDTVSNVPPPALFILQTE